MQDVAKHIVEYVKDGSASSHFAIVLYGEWGSGKTFFCEGELKDALKQESLKMCRVSLFGVSTVKEVNDRILLASLQMGSGKSQSVAKLASKLVGRLASLVASHFGLRSARLDVSADILLGLMDMGRTLIVLDDFERNNFPSDGNELYGLVNDMVENRHWHVMLVRNSPLKLDRSSCEKAISAQYKHVPDVQKIVDSTVPLNRVMSWNLPFSAGESLANAINSSGHQNARSLGRVIPLLDLIASALVSLESEYAVEGKKQVFEDVTELCIRSISGEVLVRPEREKDGTEAEYSAWGHRLLLSERYKYLSPIIAPVVAGSLPQGKVVDRCVHEYIKKFYSDSPTDSLISNLYDRYSGLRYMEDKEAIRLVNDFFCLAKEGAFSGKWIYRGWRMAKSLHELGFVDGKALRELEQYYQESIKADSASAYRCLYHDYVLWKGMEGTPADRVLDGFVEYARSLIDADGVILFDEPVGAETGQLLAKEFAAADGELYPAVFAVDAELVVQSFAQGSGVSQMALVDYFGGDLPSKLYAYNGREERLLHWIQDIRDLLPCEFDNSILGNRRLGWLRNALGSLAEELEERSVKPDLD